MNTARRIPPILGILTGISALTASAQTAATTPETATRISPFEVTVQQDTSFRSSSVGSGSRLAMDLADVAAAYSVINRSFIDALGITDVAEAAGWATGQTFYFNEGNGAGNGDRFGQAGGYTSRGIVNAPGSVFSNVGNTGNQLNFYQSGSTASDAYAVESFDFGRGPNSALFGNSNQTGFQLGNNTGLQGVASSQTKRARFDATQTAVAAEIGYWGFRRVTFDHNRPLTDTTSVRVNLVDSNQMRYQHMSYSRIRGINLTATWKPTARTNVSVTGINQTTKSKSPGSDIRERISGWDGMTTFRGPILNSFLSTTGTPGSIAPVAHPVYGSIQVLSGADRATGAAFTGLTFNGEPQGIQKRTNNHFVLDTTTMTIMDWEGFASTRMADSTSRVPVYTKSAPNGHYFVRASITPNNANTAPAYYNASSGSGGGPHSSYIPIRMGVSGMPEDMFDHALIGTSRPMLGPRDTMTNWVPNTLQRFKDLQLAVDQSVGENLYLSLGGDINRTVSSVRNEDALNSNPGINVDINQLRPDGSPNPNFLQIVSFSGQGNNKGGLKVVHQLTNDQAIRVNAIYNLNAGRWGQYTFNLNGNANTRNFLAYTQSAVLNLPGIDIRRMSAVAPVNNSVYHNDLVRTDISTVIDRTYPFTNVEYDANGIPTVTQMTIRPTVMLRGGEDGADSGNETKTDTLTQYLTFQTQAKLLNNKISVTLAGKRQFDKTQRTSAVAQGDLPGPVSFTTLGFSSVNPYGTTPWDGQSFNFRPVWAGTPTDYYNLSYQPLDPATGRARVLTSGPNAGKLQPRRLATSRPRVADTVATGLMVRNPLYQAGSPFGEQIFQDDFSPPAARKYSSNYSAGFVFRPFRGVSPFLNFSSQTIAPAIGELDMLYAVKRVVSAKEFAFGTSIDVGNKLNFRWNYYRNTRINNPANNNVVSRYNDLVNSRNIFDNLPDSTSNLLGFVTLPGNPDYTSSVNNGYEVELTLSNIVRGLRLTANGSAGSTGENQSTRFPLTKAWLLDADNQAAMKALLEDAGGTLDTSQRPDRDNGTIIVDYAPGKAVPTTGIVPNTTFALDQTKAVNAYNNAWVAYDEIIDQLAVTRSRRTPSANFFADYTVQTGPAKGLGIGAGVQWQGPRSPYNKGTWTIIDPSNPNQAIDDPRYNAQDTVWVDGPRNYQANLNYTWRMASGNSLRFALRINNPFDTQEITYSYTLQQPEGDLRKPNREHLPIQAGRILEPRNFRLTTTYTFSGGGRR